MIFNGETNELDLVHDVRYLCGLLSDDTIRYPLKDITRNCNFAVDKVVSLIFRSDSRWQWDDINNTDLPIGTTNLVSGQVDYAIATTHLKIHKVRIKDSSGNWVSLTSVDRGELTDGQLTATAGDPKRYDKVGNSIYLYPTPNYSSSNGLEVQFQRGGSYFIYTDTTKEPGFASQFHRLISLYAALDYCETNQIIGKVNMIKAKIGNPPDPTSGLVGTGLEGELVIFYSQRAGDEKPSLSLQSDDYGENYLGDSLYSNNPDGFS
mgnify:CR=1 FL=1